MEPVTAPEKRIHLNKIQELYPDGITLQKQRYLIVYANLLQNSTYLSRFAGEKISTAERRILHTRAVADCQN